MDQQEIIRPLFSVIISCYNSKKTIGKVLQSLRGQLPYNELEIILSDDCSTEDYSDIVETFNDLLIKKTSTEYNCCPGNTREAGLKVATGEWVCFSDHDDEFIPKALEILKNKIQGSLNERYYIVTGFINQNQYRENNEAKEVKASESSGWTHGKFYNLDNLIKPFDLHFKKDLKSHEDVYFTTQVNCIMEYLHSIHLDAGIYLDDLFTYVWYSHPGSLSHQYKNNVSFLEEHFIDYCEATGEVYLDSYNKKRITWTRTKECLIDTFLLYYFYSISFVYYNPDKYDRKNFDYINQFYYKVKDEFNLNTKEIWMRASDNNCFCYKQAERYSEIGTGGIIPPFTLNQWLELIASKDKVENLYSPYKKEK